MSSVSLRASKGESSAAVAGPPRILLVRLSAVGDVVNTLPALEALRAAHPSAHLGFLVEDRSIDLIRGHPAVDRVHLFPRKRWIRMAKNPFRWIPLMREVSAFVREVRGGGYEIALDFQSNLKGALHAWLSGARRRVGFGRGHCREASHLLSTEHVIPGPGVLHRVDKFLALAARVGAAEEKLRYRLPEPPGAAQRVGEFLRTASLKEFVVIHPGTSDFGKLKRWRPERFAELAARLGRERGIRSVITWGPGERDLAARIVGQSGGWAVLALETQSLLELAEVIRRARLFVGCDSGPMHLASAVSTPCVALFGPKDPRIYGPRNTRHRVVYRPEAADRPMDAISVDDAYRAAGELLEGGA